MNTARWCWTLYDAAEIHFNKKEFRPARDYCIRIVDNAWAPLHAKAHAYEMLALMSTNYVMARRFLDRGLEVCKRMEGITSEDIKLNAEALANVERLIAKAEAKKAELENAISMAAIESSSSSKAIKTEAEEGVMEGFESRMTPAPVGVKGEDEVLEGIGLKQSEESKEGEDTF